MDLNRLYRSQPALYDLDFEGQGFEWIDCHDSSQSVLSYLRKDRSGKEMVAAVFNFTPVARANTARSLPGGKLRRGDLRRQQRRKSGGVESEPVSWTGRPHSVIIALPPLGVVVLGHEPPESAADAMPETEVTDDGLDADAQ